jgi:hypothetical protein
MVMKPILSDWRGNRRPLKYLKKLQTKNQKYGKENFRSYGSCFEECLYGRLNGGRSVKL